MLLTYDFRTCGTNTCETPARVGRAEQDGGRTERIEFKSVDWFLPERSSARNFSPGKRIPEIVQRSFNSVSNSKRLSSENRRPRGKHYEQMKPYGIGHGEGGV